ncbi:MAG: type II secretion system F family protein [Methylococcaceae bacterium]|nr:type II secretion system F family protein [Methylococcaceae bacterium]
MDYIIQFFLNITGDEETGRWIVILLIALAVFAVVIAAAFLIFGIYNPIWKRLHSVTGTEQKEGTGFRSSAETLGNYFVIRDRPGEELSYTRQRLLYAGLHTKNSLAHYYGIRIILILFLSIGSFLICSTLYPDIKKAVLLMVVSAASAAGFIGPSFLLDKKVAARQKLIRNSFPDAVDQLIVCTEAGLGLEMGLQRIAKDTGLSNEVMGHELGLVNAELRAGVDRERALKNLVQRTGVEEIRGLVSAISQSLRFGTSIAATLRVYADELRDKRMQRAEEEAAKLAITMLFPLAFCFFPGIFIVILGPAMISIYKNLG